MEALIKHEDIDPNVQNKRGETALMLACSQGELRDDPSLVEILLTHPNIDVNIGDQRGVTALDLTTYGTVGSVLEFHLNPYNVNLQAEQFIFFSVYQLNLIHGSCLHLNFHMLKTWSNT